MKLSLGAVGAGPLVGRAEQLEKLLDATLAGTSVCFIDGEAGVGKTRLIEELASRSAEIPVLVAVCQPLRDPLPLFPVVELVRQLGADLHGVTLDPVCGSLRSLVPELASLLPPALPPSQDRHVHQHQLFRGFRSVLAALGPAIVVFDDLHWVDDVSADFLQFLLGDLPPGLRLVLSSRIPIAARIPARVALTRVSLLPLDVEGVRDMIAGLLQTDRVSSEFSIIVHDRTAGMPYAVEEWLRLLQDRGELALENGRWTRPPLDELHVPAAIRDTVVERLAHLSPAARKAVVVTAVCGVAIDDDMLGAVAGWTPNDVSGAVAEGLHSELLRRDARGRFDVRHALARQAVYEATDVAERRSLHRRFADVLLRGEAPPAQLAHHFREAGATEEWLLYGEAAADSAAALFDEAGACRLLERMLQEPELTLEQTVRLATSLARAATAGLAHREAARVLGRVLREKLPRQTRGELRSYRGHALLQAGTQPEAFDDLLASLPDLTDDANLLARAMGGLSLPLHLSWTMDQHWEWVERASAVASSSGEPQVATAVCRMRAAWLLFAGAPEGCAAAEEDRLREDTALERRLRTRALLNFASGALYTGRLVHARAWLDEAERVGREASFSRLHGDSAALEVMLRWMTGEWTGLAALADDLIEVAQDLPHDRVPGLIVRGALEAVRGNARTASADLSVALALSIESAWAPALPIAAGWLARLHVRGGDGATALSVCRPAIEVLRCKDAWAWAADLLPVTVTALVGAGDATAGSALVKEVAAGTEGRDTPPVAAAIAEALGHLAEIDGDKAGAAAAYESAARLWSAIPRPYDAALAREAWARVADDVAAQAAAVADALEVLHHLGATDDVRRFRSVLRARSFPLPSEHRGGRQAYGDALSPREREVAELVAVGKTNAEIAVMLFLSPRTVAHHVERAMRKQRAPTRSALLREPSA